MLAGANSEYDGSTMSSKVFELGHFQLRSSQARLKLSVSTFMFLRMPQSLSTLDDVGMLETLAFGDVWISRGKGCHLDIQISIDGQSFTSDSFLHLLESLGQRIRDAPLWSQLSLLATLQISRNNRFDKENIHLSIFLRHHLAPSPVKQSPRAWLLDDIDINPPSSIPQAEFERLKLQFDFLTIQESPPPVTKRVQVRPDATGFQDPMLLDCNPILLEENGMVGQGQTNEVLSKGLSNPISRRSRPVVSQHKPEALEQAVEELSHGLSARVARCFEPMAPKNFIQYQSLAKLPILRPLLPNFQVPKSLELKSTLRRGSRNKSNSRRHRLPEVAIGILRLWMDAHAENPYPSQADKQNFLKQTGLQRGQLNNWLQNARRKFPITKQSDHQKLILLPLCSSPEAQDKPVPTQSLEALVVERYGREKPAVVSRDMERVELNDILASNIMTPRSLASQCSPFTSSSPYPSMSLSQGHDSLDRAMHTGLSLPLLRDLSLPCQLAESALQVLISGSRRGLGNIEVVKSSLLTSIASLVPAMFCPGFKQSMAHNARFVPTIASAVCGSGSRNVQGVGLKRKLVLLADLQVSASSSGEEESESLGGKGTAQRLKSVVENRLWGMMQKTLFDPAAVRKLATKTAEAETRPWDSANGGDALLQMVEVLDAEHTTTEEVDLSGTFRECLLFEDESSEFEDLLADGFEEELVGCWSNDKDSERERFAVERETDEILFGSAWDFEDADAEEEGEGEEMLLDDDQSQKTDEDELLV